MQSIELAHVYYSVLKEHRVKSAAFPSYKPSKLDKIGQYCTNWPTLKACNFETPHFWPYVPWEHYNKHGYALPIALVWKAQECIWTAIAGGPKTALRIINYPIKFGTWWDRDLILVAIDSPDHSSHFRALICQTIFRKFAFFQGFAHLMHAQRISSWPIFSYFFGDSGHH